MRDEKKENFSLICIVLFILFKKYLKQKIKTVSIFILDGGFTDISLILWTLFLSILKRNKHKNKWPSLAHYKWHNI